eukprot:TRINITY_DN6593_c0_g5_i1.p1 TRINITY_DN6593_c0_g5~~TRINITY_DN6593_c0_g5_i1.p1  ORF type:complete len:124 (-),score=43.98 TRINITY_DN6593_c0_g5_i1:147-518(-)
MQTATATTTTRPPMQEASNGETLAAEKEGKEAGNVTPRSSSLAASCLRRPPRPVANAPPTCESSSATATAATATAATATAAVATATTTTTATATTTTTTATTTTATPTAASIATIAMCRSYSE